MEVILRSHNYPSKYVSRGGYTGPLCSQIRAMIMGRVSHDEKSDSKLVVRPALCRAPGAISLESRTTPGRFLRHRSSELWLDPIEHTALFGQDASFKVVPGLADASGVSFQSVNYPGKYIRHAGGLLFIADNDKSALLAADATFHPTTPDGAPFALLTLALSFNSKPVPALQVMIRSHNFASDFFCHEGADGPVGLDDLSVEEDKKNSVFSVKPALCGAPGAISLECGKDSGIYVRHSWSVIKGSKDDGTDLMHQDASFRLVSGLADKSGVTFQSVNFPAKSIRHDGYGLILDNDGHTKDLAADATFHILTPLRAPLPWASLLPESGASGHVAAAAAVGGGAAAVGGAGGSAAAT